MNDHEDTMETDLRGGLDLVLGTVTPGPAPFDAVITRGRTIRRKRRWAWSGTASAIAILALAASLLVPGALHGRSQQPPVSTTTGPITVDSAAWDEAHHVMGSGLVDGKEWRLTYTTETYLAPPDKVVPGLKLSAVIEGRSVVGDTWVTDATAPNPMSGISWMQVGENSPAGLGFAPVTADVGSIVAQYANGQSVSFPVVSYKGKHYVVIVSRAASVIDKLTAYRWDGSELGFEEPITFPGYYSSSPMTGGMPWYAPGQVPSLAPAEATFTGPWAGTSFTSPWGGTSNPPEFTIEVRAGGFGICAYDIHLPSPSMSCSPANGPAGYRYISSTNASPWDILVEPLDPTVTRVTVTLVGGKKVQLPVHTIDGKVMAAGEIVMDELTGVTAYDASGKAFPLTLIK
jgi:hypothetical protein